MSLPEGYQQSDHIERGMPWEWDPTKNWFCTHKYLHLVRHLLRIWSYHNWKLCTFKGSYPKYILSCRSRLHRRVWCHYYWCLISSSLNMWAFLNSKHGLQSKYRYSHSKNFHWLLKYLRMEDRMKGCWSSKMMVLCIDISMETRFDRWREWYFSTLGHSFLYWYPTPYYLYINI